MVCFLRYKEFTFSSTSKCFHQQSSFVNVYNHPLNTLKDRHKRHIQNYLQNINYLIVSNQSSLKERLTLVDQQKHPYWNLHIYKLYQT